MNKVAIVTGASRGIGAATALLLAESGYTVCVNYHQSKAQAERVVETITQKKGKAFTHQADVAKESDTLNLFARVHQEFGPIDALINNAAVNGGTSPVEEVTLNCLQTVFATNVFGTILSCREAVKSMKQKSGGGIVNISSEAAKFGGTRIAHYAASKAAINTFTVGLAREVAPYNIRVNAVSPGVIDTEMHHNSSKERMAHLLNTLPMGRMGKPEEVAQLVLWLLSPQAAYVSGAVIPITGSR